MRLFFGFSNNVKYLDGTLLNSSSFSSKVGKCLGVIKSSSYSSSSSDQPPPKTESSLSSRISPRLKSSLRSSARESKLTSLYVNDLRKTERKTKENALTISALNTISTSFLSVLCSIFLRDKIEQNSIFFARNRKVHFFCNENQSNIEIQFLEFLFFVFGIFTLQFSLILSILPILF